MSGATYEMFWDCGYCGTKKLLGLTHRHCPECGAPQNAEGRYFPEEHEKVAVHEHVYHGVDRTCGSCGQASSRRAKHCPRCGAPLEGGKDVARKIAGESGEPSRGVDRALRASAPRKSKKSKRKLVVATGVVAVGGVVAGGALWTETGTLSVVGHRWKREVVIERFGPTQDSAWCDSMPGDARDIRRSREVRSHREIPDGESCTMHKVDQGDGTYREEESCTPKTRSEPVYDDRCSYTVHRWAAARRVLAEGQALSEPLMWPAFTLAREGDCIGCEREGRRNETLTVIFEDQERREHSCVFDRARWSSLAIGSSFRGKLGVVTGKLDCASLEAQE